MYWSLRKSNQKIKCENKNNKKLKKNTKISIVNILSCAKQIEKQQRACDKQLNRSADTMATCVRQMLLLIILKPSLLLLLVILNNIRSQIKRS